MAAKPTLDEILTSIDELAFRGQVTREKAFAAWYAINFYSVDEDDALDAASADGGNDQGIDIVFIDEASESLMVIQAHCPQNQTKQTPKSKWDAVLASLPYLKNPKALRDAGRADLADLIESANKDHRDLTLTLGLISLGQKSEEITNALNVSKVGDQEVSYFYSAQDEITAQYKAIVLDGGGVSSDYIDFAADYFEDKGEYGRAIVGSVSAAELQRLHKAYPQELFAGNIRLFLGARKGGINEQIIKTARDHPGLFWALNNGVTIVADTIDTTVDKSPRRVGLKRFSIVNGCQTTSSLVHADAPPSAKVLVRVIAAKQNIRTDIVRYNNSQNAVRIWSVRSADNIQKSLRKDFQSIGVSYAPKLEGARRRKDMAIIELDKVAQFLASGYPEYLIPAIANKGELFDEPYQTIFFKGITAKDVYLAWLVGNLAEAKRLKLQSDLKDDDNSGLLGVTSTYWISYAARKLIEKRNDFASKVITLECMTRKEFKSALEKYIDASAEAFWDAAVDAYDEDFGSFKSALRSSAFFKKVDSKLSLRITKILSRKEVPELKQVCKSSAPKGAAG
ncbi:AIPR family protein [Sphingomonas sp.]|uniref:AIPR family protein n=1 Tax=Sphingomonas sp. TaxID=28214 RepID=UPI002EDB5A29